MTIYYNAQDRKPLVKAISEFTGADAVYMRTPTYAYQIDYFTVTREGNLEFDDSAEHGESVGLTVEVPLDGSAVKNLTKLLDAKGRLIRRALAVDSLQIEVTDSTVRFPWFADCGADECKAYTHFISALCELAANAKRVTAKEKEIDNDKYAFRCFLLRLGFIGSEYKEERKILLRNLTGSSAFRNGGAANEVSE